MSELESAKYWLAWIRRGKTIAAFCVAIAVAGEFVADILSAPFQKTVEDARQMELARLDKDASDQRERAAKLEADNLRMQTAIQPRRLTPEQAIEFRWRMSAVAPRKFKMEVPSYNDMEASVFALQLLKILKDLRWDEEDAHFDVYAGPFEGVVIIPGLEPDSGEVSQIFSDSLRALGFLAFPASEFAKIEPAGDRITVRVGVKPLPVDSLANICD